jgi:hypothetical protein
MKIKTIVIIIIMIIHLSKHIPPFHICFETHFYYTLYRDILEGTYGSPLPPPEGTYGSPLPPPEGTYGSPLPPPL